MGVKIVKIYPRSPTMLATIAQVRQAARQGGFTLIEMVMTIILVGIIAGMLAPVIQNSVTAYSDTQSRAHLLDKVRVAFGRLSRELRQATVPTTSVAGNVLEFYTTTVGGRYVDFNGNTPNIANADCSRLRNPPGSLQRFLPNESIATLCVLYPGTLSAFTANALIIGSDVVAVNTVTAQVSGSPDDYDGALWHINFSAAHTFASASASDLQIFGLADFHHRILLSGTNLVWERVDADVAGFGGAVSGILLNNVSAFAVTLNAATGIVNVTISVSEGGESISVSEDIYVRN